MVDETAKMMEDLLNNEKDKDKNGDKGKNDANVGVTDEEKNQFFKEKNIQVNMSTNDVDDAAKITKKPKKKSVKSETTNTDKELKTISTQTPRDVLK